MSHRPTHVLVPTDFSRTAKAALDYALGLCEQVGARLTVLHVTNRAKIEEELKGFDALGYLFDTSESMASGGTVQPASLQWERLEQRARQQLEASIDPAWRNRVAIDFVCRDGYPSETIKKFATENGVDLIVMGTHGRGRAAQFVMGSVTQNVIRAAECPVLTLKAPPEPGKENECG
jgi:nucleotide-binding universal stress UspA family protein